jgi:hypothetical protein
MIVTAGRWRSDVSRLAAEDNAMTGFTPIFNADGFCVDLGFSHERVEAGRFRCW